MITKPKSRKQSGSALVELGLFAPTLVLIVAGAIDFARVYNASVTLSNAAEVGALYGSRSVSASSDTTGMQSAATNDGKDLTGMTATANYYCSCGQGTAAASCPATGCSVANPAHRYVKVTATYTFNTFFPIPGIPSSVPMSRTAILRVQ